LFASILCTGSGGGILVASQLFDTSGSVTGAFIMILAAPPVVAYRQEAADQGLISDDIWDDSALQGFDSALVTFIAHCPILVAQEGHSRTPSLPTKVENVLLDSQPLRLTEGELIGAKVKHGEDVFLRPFLFMEVCNLPLLGLRSCIGDSAITLMTYLGAAIPGCFCPNFAYHFKIDG
jgi:hypothetical protein